MKDPKDKLMDQIQKAINTNQDLDVTNMTETATHTRLIPKTTERSSRKGLDIHNFPVVSANFEQFNLAMSILGDEYNIYSRLWLERYPNIDYTVNPTDFTPLHNILKKKEELLTPKKFIPPISSNIKYMDGRIDGMDVRRVVPVFGGFPEGVRVPFSGTLQVPLTLNTSSPSTLSPRSSQSFQPSTLSPRRIDQPLTLNTLSPRSFQPSTLSPRRTSIKNLSSTPLTLSPRRTSVQPLTLNTSSTLSPILQPLTLSPPRISPTLNSRSLSPSVLPTVFKPIRELNIDSNSKMLNVNEANKMKTSMGQFTFADIAKTLSASKKSNLKSSANPILLLDGNNSLQRQEKAMSNAAVNSNFITSPSIENEVRALNNKSSSPRATFFGDSNYRTILKNQLQEDY